MKKPRSAARIILPSVMILFFTVSPLLTFAADMKPEDLVAQHLNAIASSETRATVKSRAVQGKLVLKLLVGGRGTVDGSWGEVSELRKSNFVMRFGLGDYRGEQFVCNESRVYIAFATSNQKRSRFGEFLHSQDYILKEGIFGGVLTTGWALLHLDENHPKLVFAGRKKVDGKEVYDLEYHSKHTSDMQIHLYFDPENFHHVKTLYQMAFSPNMGPTVTSSVNQQEVRYTIEERFSDFKTADGVTLPSTYSIEYSEELQSGRTNVYHWDMTAESIQENVGLDPKNFDTK